MRTNKQIQASRCNGALSPGSATNAAQTIVLDTESAPRYAAHRRAYRRALEDLLALKTAKLRNEPNSPQNQEAA